VRARDIKLIIAAFGAALFFVKWLPALVAIGKVAP
jgi:hypothetical protein